jgi:hypothetical protein
MFPFCSYFNVSCKQLPTVKVFKILNFKYDRKNDLTDYT